MLPERPGSLSQIAFDSTSLSGDGFGEDEALAGVVLGISESARWLRFFISRVALCESNVLITGPVGSGKDLVAKSIHDLSRRKNGPLLQVNCPGISEGQFEPPFLSRENSKECAAYRAQGLLERANGGSIYFEEISDLPLSMQGRLTEFLERDKIPIPGQDGPLPIDVRIISSTKNDLPELICQEKFREDFYYRLNVVSIHVPNLVERIHDLPLLAQKFLDEANRHMGLRLKGITEKAIAILSAYHWPGNIRELKNVIERAVIFRQGDSIGEAEVRIALREQISQKNSKDSFQSQEEMTELGRTGIQLGETMEQIEKEFIERALQETKGSQVEAAKMLGISSKNLWKKIRKHEIDSSRTARLSEVADGGSSPNAIMGYSKMVQEGRSI